MGQAKNRGTQAERVAKAFNDNVEKAVKSLTVAYPELPDKAIRAIATIIHTNRPRPSIPVPIHAVMDLAVFRGFVWRQKERDADFKCILRPYFSLEVEQDVADACMAHVEAYIVGEVDSGMIDLKPAIIPNKLWSLRTQFECLDLFSEEERKSGLPLFALDVCTDKRYVYPLQELPLVPAPAQLAPAPAR